MPESKRAIAASESIDSESPCIFCGAAESLPLYPTYSISGDNFYLNRCLECQVVFLSPAPTQEQLDQAYDDSYYGRGREKFGGRIEGVLDHFRRARARRVRKFVRPPAKILDIGCGNGRFLGHLIDQGFDGYGIELPGKAAQRAGRIPALRLKVGGLAPEDYESNFFDGVCMWHVFEHLRRPKETLHIIREILKPGGYLMMSLPNIDSLQSRLFRGKWLHLDPPKHLFFLGPADLISTLGDFGFRLIKQIYFSMEQNPFGMQQSILNCLLSKRDVLFEALKGNDAYAREYGGFSILLQKIFYVGTFPAFVLLAGAEAALRRGGTMECVFRKEKA